MAFRATITLMGSGSRITQGFEPRGLLSFIVGPMICAQILKTFSAVLVGLKEFIRQGSGLGFGPPKNRKSVRTIDLDEETVALLREQQERQRFDRHASGSSYGTDLDLVFCRPGGSPEDPSVIGRRFERRVRALATVPVIALHGLRHTHATLLLEAGVDVKTVSERLGHDSA